MIFMLILFAVFLFVILNIFVFRYDKRGFDRKGIHKNGTKYDNFGFDINGYDKRGFNRKGIHKNGTKYDNFGFDVNGYDKKGYDINGYDKKGYNCKGYNIRGYNTHGVNYDGKYNRFFDVNNYFNFEYSEDGFLDPKIYPIKLTNHARERMAERMPDGKSIDLEKLALEAYSFGKSSRQLKKTSAGLVKDIEYRDDNSIVLIHKGYVYVFTKENVLKTVYKNEYIPI